MARIMARTATTDGIIGRHDFPAYLLGKSCKSGINVTPSMTFTFTFIIFIDNLMPYQFSTYFSTTL